MMEIIKKIMSNIRWENMAPGTEFARDFCAGIGPLQLGVVLVVLFYMSMFCDGLALAVRME